jgi:DeoR/GlpR family transcriptional regulator of sugar metabolism
MKVKTERTGEGSTGAAAQQKVTRGIKELVQNNGTQANGAAGHDINVSAAWVTTRSGRQPASKLAIAQYAAGHLIEYGDVIQLGSGTTLNALMDKIIERQIEQKKALDLIILTSNLQVLSRASEAKSNEQSLLGTMQIILTGGALQPSLDSLIGEFAAAGVKTELIQPTTSFFGAQGLSFRDGLTIRYQFEEEISTQVAYAMRPTSRRVLLVDHTKFGSKTGWKAGLTLESLLSNTETCYVITTLPEGDSEEDVRWRRVIEQEEHELRASLRNLLRADTKGEYDDKQFALLLVDSDAKIVRQVALSEIKDEMPRKAKKTVSV